jgi:hypothetical protein
MSEESPVADDFEQITVGVEKIAAIMVTPIDRLGAFDSSLRQTLRGRSEIVRADAKSVMALAKRMANPGLARGRGQCRPLDTKKGQILVTAAQQNLITEPSNNCQSEDVCVEFLSPFEVGDFYSEMVKPLQFHAQWLR